MPYLAKRFSRFHQHIIIMEQPGSSCVHDSFPLPTSPSDRELGKTLGLPKGVPSVPSLVLMDKEAGESKMLEGDVNDVKVREEKALRISLTFKCSEARQLRPDLSAAHTAWCSDCCDIKLTRMLTTTIVSLTNARLAFYRYFVGHDRY